MCFFCFCFVFKNSFVLVVCLKTICEETTSSFTSLFSSLTRRVELIERKPLQNFRGQESISPALWRRAQMRRQSFFGTSRGCSVSPTKLRPTSPLCSTRKYAELLRPTPISSALTYWHKSCQQNVDEINPWAQFHQHSMGSFCTGRHTPVKYKPKMQAQKSCVCNLRM